jgi:hypothetical protein
MILPGSKRSDADFVFVIPGAAAGREPGIYNP